MFEDTVWLTQKQMAELFDTTVANINIHLKNCYAEEEIAFYPTIKDFLIVRQEGSRSVTRKVSHYSLDAILSIGYRIKSARATQFRRWATKVLKQYMLQGYAVSATRLSKITDQLDTLDSSHKELRDDISAIKSLLLKLVDKPINININNQLSSSRLEEKLIELIDQVKDSLQSEALQTELSLAKQDIASCSTDVESKERLIGFFAKLGDSKSSLNKAIKGAGIAKNIIAEILKLGNKLKDLL